MPNGNSCNPCCLNLKSAAGTPTDRRRVMINAILYVLKGGIPW